MKSVLLLQSAIPRPYCCSPCLRSLSCIERSKGLNASLLSAERSFHAFRQTRYSKPFTTKDTKEHRVGFGESVA